jgi:hypothetical protein
MVKLEYLNFINVVVILNKQRSLTILNFCIISRPNLIYYKRISDKYLVIHKQRVLQFTDTGPRKFICNFGYDD